MTCPTSERFLEWLEHERVHDSGLREHIDSCACCRAELATLRTLRARLGQLKLAPAAAGFSEELAAKLGRRRRAAGAGYWVTGLAACALLALLQLERAAPAFRARGGTPAEGARVGFEVRVHGPSGEDTSLPAARCLAADSGYSFVVFNRTRKEQSLMLFALDARREVHWFYPAYPDARTNPRAITIGATPQVLTLPDGVTPEDVAPGELQFVAMFSGAPHTVAEIETLLQRGGPAAIRGADPSAIVQVTAAQVCP